MRIDDKLNRADKLIKTFGKRMATDRLIRCFTCVNILLLCGVVGYFVFKNSTRRRERTPQTMSQQIPWAGGGRLGLETWRHSWLVEIRYCMLHNHHIGKFRPVWITTFCAPMFNWSSLLSIIYKLQSEKLSHHPSIFQAVRRFSLAFTCGILCNHHTSQLWHIRM